MISRIVIDDNLRQQFENLSDAAELCDSQGQVVAYAFNPAQYRDLLYAWAVAQLPNEPVSAAEEFQREGGMTIQEVHEFLKTIGTDEAK